MSKQRQKGTSFETAAARYYSEIFGDVTRNPLQGAKDKGDLRGLTVGGFPVVVEVKNHAHYDLSTWTKQLEAEMQNTYTPFGFVLFHRNRVGIQNMQDQFVLMPNHVLTALLLRLKELEND